MRIAIIGLVAVSLGGCATVTRGTTNKVTFESEPSGAQMTATTGASCQTPCTLEFNRKTDFVAVFTKEGFQETRIPVNTRVAGEGALGFAGNIIAGGGIGMVADAVSGATLEHYPNPVIARLEPIKPVSPVIDRRQRRKPATPTS